MKIDNSFFFLLLYSNRQRPTRFFYALSVPPAGPELNRDTRMKMAHAQVLAAEPETVLVKLADRLHNLQTIKGAKSDGFIRVYCAETEHLLTSVRNVARKNGWEIPWMMVHGVNKMLAEEVA